MTRTIAKTIDNYLDTIQAIILSLLMKLGPFIVALMPAAFTGYAVYRILEPEAGWVVASFFALVVSTAIETVGIVSIHTTIDLYNGWEAEHIKPVKFWVMVAMIPFYVIAVDFTVWFGGDAFPPLVQALGFVSPWLIVVMYTAVALARDLGEVKRQVAGKHSEARETRQATKKDNLERFRITEESRVKIAVAEMQHSEPAAQLAKPAKNFPPTLPEWCETLPESREHFRQLVAQGRIQLPEKITGAELARQVPNVGSTRSGQNWLSDVREQPLISINSKNGV